jgi:hypothetical protein
MLYEISFLPKSAAPGLELNEAEVSLVMTTSPFWLLTCTMINSNIGYREHEVLQLVQEKVCDEVQPGVGLCRSIGLKFASLMVGNARPLFTPCTAEYDVNKALGEECCKRPSASDKPKSRMWQCCGLT